MKKKNGFTLVELLAVIVILAIIMVIAIPSVLEVMNRSRRHLFAEMAQKVVRDTETRYISDSNPISGTVMGAGYVVYDIAELGYQTLGNYQGYVIVNAFDVDHPEYILFLWDNNYMLINYNTTKNSLDIENSGAVLGYQSSTVSSSAGSKAIACQTAAGEGQSCRTKEGTYLVIGD